VLVDAGRQRAVKPGAKFQNYLILSALFCAPDSGHVRRCSIEPRRVPAIMQRTTSSPNLEPLAVSPGEAARLAGLGRTTIYEALGSGDLKSMKIGKRRLITVAALRDWLSSHEVRL
jgi:excisionase family DNA binding protein